MPWTGVDFQPDREHVVIRVMTFLKKASGIRQCVESIVLEKRNWEKLRFCYLSLFVFTIVGQANLGPRIPKLQPTGFWDDLTRPIEFQLH